MKHLILTVLVALALTSCGKISVNKLYGTWQYDADPRYKVTFNTNGTLGLTAPVALPGMSTDPTFTLSGDMLLISVSLGSATVNEQMQILSLEDQSLTLFYQGEYLFNGESLNGEYSLTRVR